MRRHKAQMRHWFISLVSLLSACSGGTDKDCGESFCLPSGMTWARQDTPEDFNLYDIQQTDKSFRIYEGNHPRKSNVTRRAIDLQNGFDASIAVEHGIGSILFRMEGTKWPEYIEISGACASGSDCSVIEFARRIQRHTP